MVLITSDFVFIHLPKTGGSSLQFLIRRVAIALVLDGKTYRDKPLVLTNSPKFSNTLGNRPFIKYSHPDDGLAGHSTVDHIPESYRHLPIIGSVRNPFTWYVSRFFEWNTLRPSHELKGVSTVEEFIKDRPGYYTEQHQGVFNNRTDIYYIKMENQKEEFINTLAEIRGVPTSSELREIVYSISPQNISTKKKITDTQRRGKLYREYYSDSLIDLVLQNDSYLFDTFYPDREFPEEPQLELSKKR